MKPFNKQQKLNYKLFSLTHTFKIIQSKTKKDHLKIIKFFIYKLQATLTEKKDFIKKRILKNIQIGGKQKRKKFDFDKEKNDVEKKSPT